MSAAPIPDPSQQPITSADPRVAKILAMIQAQAQQAPVDTTPSAPSQAVLPQQQVPPAPTPQVNPQTAPNVANMPSMQPQQPQAQLPAPTMPNVQPQPGPVKSFLQHLVSGLGTTAYAGTQGALQRLGIPTDYEKQQDALKIGLQQQAQNTNEGYRQFQEKLLGQQVAASQAGNQMVTLPNNPIFGTLAGTQVRQSDLPKLLTTGITSQTKKDVVGEQGQNALSLESLKQAGGNPRDHVLRSVNGQIGLYNKRDGSLVKDLGSDTAMITGPRNAVARAQANAAYGVSNVMDANGNPMAVSRLQQLQTGTPTMTDAQTMNLQGDKLGVQTYLQANQRVRDNLGVLNDSVQRGIIARATEDIEKNPGAFDSIVSSAFQDGLSPAGGNIIAGMKQMNEFGSTFKKYTGNGGAATDSLRATIHSNQPSTANSNAVNLNLLAQDEALARGVQSNLNRPGTYAAAPKTPTAAKPSTSSGDHPFFSKFGGKALPQ